MKKFLSKFFLAVFAMSLMTAVVSCGEEKADEKKDGDKTEEPAAGDEH